MRDVVTDEDLYATEDRDDIPNNTQFLQSNMSVRKIKSALVSVYHKDGLEEILRPSRACGLH